MQSASEKALWRLVAGEREGRATPCKFGSPPNLGAAKRSEYLGQGSGHMFGDLGICGWHFECPF